LDEEEDIVPEPADKKQPESNEIAIREPFEIGNDLKIIYDIAVDGGPRKIANWKIHEGSTVEIYGSGLGLYDQVFLWVAGSAYRQELVDKTQDGRMLSFKVGNEFTNAYEDGTGVILEFADTKNRANNRFLKQKLKYFKQTEEEKKRAAQAAEEERLKQQSSFLGGQPGVIGQIINQSIGAPVTGLAQGLAGSRDQSRPRTSTLAGAIKKSGQAESNAEDLDADSAEDLAPDVGVEEILKTSNGAEVNTSGQINSNEVNISGQQDEVVTPGGTVSVSGRQEAGAVGATVSAAGQTVGGTITSGVSGGANIKTEASVKKTSSVSQTVSGQTKSKTTVSGSSQTTQTTKTSTQTSGNVAAAGEIKSEQNVSTTETESATQKISGQGSGQASGQISQSQETQTESSVSREKDVKATTSTKADVSKIGSDGGKRQTLVEATQENKTQTEQKVQAEKNISAQAEDRRSEVGESEGRQEETVQPVPESIDEDKEKDRGIQTSEKDQPEKKDQSDQKEVKNKTEIKPSATVQGKTQAPEAIQSPRPQKSAPSEVVSPPAGISSMLNKLAANDAKLQPAIGSKQQIDGAGRREKPVNLADTMGAGAEPKKEDENRKVRNGGPEVGNRRSEGLPQTENRKPEVGESEAPEGSDVDRGALTNNQGQQKTGSESESEEENQDEEEPELSPTEQARQIAVNNPFIRRLANSEAASRAVAGEKQLAGLATSRVWNWAVTGAYLSGFTVIGFYLGLIVMDVYWALLHRRDKKLFPLAGWQKAVTVITNLIGITVPLLLIAIIFYVGCNFPMSGRNPIFGYKGSALGSIIGDSCQSFDLTLQRPTSVNPTGEVGGLPAGGGPLSTGDWNKTILEVSSMYQIDACILKVVVQKESANVKDASGKNAADRAIGCDCAANGHPEYCPDKRKVYSSDYQFNWAQCSYGIGITQWTIFPQGRSGYMAWQSSGIPSRNLVYGVSGHPDIWYTVNDLLNPTTSLELAAKTFLANMKKVNSSGPPFNRSDVQAAFMAYVGSSGRQAQLVADRMALYDMCKNSSGTAAP
jgi:hypothetical protein